MTDFFISYTQADRSWAEWIAWTLEAAGYTSKIQAWDFGPGKNFVVEMDTASREAERTLFVLSPDSLRSAFAKAEWAAAFARDPSGEKGILVPVRVSAVALEGLLASLVYVDLVDLEEAAARERLLQGLAGGRGKPVEAPSFPGGRRPRFPADLAALPLEELPVRGPLPPGSRMLFAPNPLFVGREDDLRTLAKQLRVGETSAIGEVEIAAASGLGGTGKTQLACEFVHRYGRYFPGGAFWMSFADGATVPAEVAACGRALDLHPNWEALPLAEQVRLVRETWSQPAPRLLVFDNCEDESLLSEWRPSFGGARVLVTSRRSRWSRALGVESVPITTLPRPMSVELLRKFRPDLAEGDAGLDGIASELGDLPLALHLAGSFLDRYAQAPFGQPAAYLESLRKGNLLDHPSLQGKLSTETPTRHELHVGKTFALSLDRLDPDDEVDALARALLARAAYFAPGEPIPRELLLKTIALDGEETAFRAEDALGRLTVLGLLESGSSGSLVIHRLVAALALGLAESRDAQASVQEGVYEEANRINASGFPGRLVAWQAHLRHVADRAWNQEDAVATLLFSALDSDLSRTGDRKGAQRYSERAVAIREEVLGPEHPDTATSLNNLGFLLEAVGRPLEARSYYQRALAVLETCLGPDHPDTKVVRGNLQSCSDAGIA